MPKIRTPMIAGLLALLTSAGIGLNGASDPETNQAPGVSFSVAGTTYRLRTSPRALLTSDGGLQISAFSGDGVFRAVTFHIPKPGKGSYDSRDTVGMTLHYSASVHSSSYKDHYDVHPEVADSWVKVAITRWGGAGESIEGTFSALARSGPGSQETLAITNGAFQLTVTTGSVANTRR